MFGPDLDTLSRPYRRWSVLRWIWLPYRLFGHRSKWTHGLIRGPLVRLLYLTVMLGGAYVLLHLLMAWQGVQLPDLRALEARLGRIPSRLAAFALGGLWLGGALHTLADGLVSGWKRRRKRR